MHTRRHLTNFFKFFVYSHYQNYVGFHTENLHEKQQNYLLASPYKTSQRVMLAYTIIQLYIAFRDVIRFSIFACSSK